MEQGEGGRENKTNPSNTPRSSLEFRESRRRSGGKGERESQRGFWGRGRTEETDVGILMVHADAHLDGRDGVLGLLQASEDVGNDRLDR